MEKSELILFNYTALLEDGTVVDKSADGIPTELRTGDPDNLPELEAFLLKLDKSEEGVLTLPPGKAFGEVNPSLIVAVGRKSLPGDFTAKAGEWLTYETDANEQRIVKVEEISESEVVFNHNHPLAGKTLTYRITRI